MATIRLEIVSAELEIFSGDVDMVFAPAVMGEVGIAPRHAPLLTTMKPGEVRAKMPDGAQESFYVSGGILEVQPHVVTVLSDTALRAEDVDEAAALESQRQAEQALRDQKGDQDYAKILAEAAAQIETIRRLRKGR